jgi:penicillin-binding protein 1C
LSSSPKILAKAAAALGGLALILWAAPLALPYARADALRRLEFSRVVLDAKGGELQVLPLGGGLRRVFTPLSAMPPELLEIAVRAEDRRFWLHPGVDPLAIGRAARQNRQAGRTVSGASTIPMQLSRLLRPGEARVGKTLEAWEAMQLDRRLGKRGELELYLNLVPFGHNVEGFPAAARAFFGKSLPELTRTELLILAVVPRAPGSYDPRENPGANRAAVMRLGLYRGGADGLDTAYERVLDPARPGIWPFWTPHYVRWLAAQSAIDATRGREPIRTAIEPELQGYLEELLASTVESARAKRVSNAAAIFIRPGTMSIAAWVGSIDFKDEAASGQVDGVTMQRQPGSTLKPFLYSIALERGLTAASVLPDIPTDFGGAEVYTPANFNDQFNGPVRLRQALASSLNVPAVNMLRRVGVGPFTDRLLAAGFASLERQRGRLGLGLALGNAEVSLLELTQAYGIFLHGGRFEPIRAVPSAAPPKDAARQVATKASAALIRDILTRHPDRVLAFGRDGTSRLRFDAAMKTGTSNQFNNIWAVGFTPDLLGGVWLGNFGGQTVVGTADSGYPASVMRKMLELFSEHAAFPPMEGFVQVPVCALSGMRATDACPHAILEWFVPGTEPAPCDWHLPASSGTAVQYPQEYREWLARYRYRPAAGFQDSALDIRRPLDGAVFYIDPSLPADKQQFAIEATGNGEARIEVDGNPIYRGPLPARAWQPLEAGVHLIALTNGRGRVESEYRVR